MSNEQCVIVGMSGGVDSSVALYLLGKEYPCLIGASHDICTDSLTCNDETLGRAARLAERFGIPYWRFNMVDAFNEAVIDDFAHEYYDGRTPNPCVRCNERIRFTAFFERCREQALTSGICADPGDLLFATGHYARVSTFEGHVCVEKGKDRKKDQSYMLYRIPKEILPSVRFPLGEYTKEEIVEIALREGFPSSSVKESQDICFIPGKYTDKLIEIFSEKVVRREGPIVDEGGKRLGTHRGYMFYTIGQRQGLGLGNGPWYVKRLDPAKNQVVVGRQESLLDDMFSLTDENWFIPADRTAQLAEEGRIMVKIRYNSPERPCRIARMSDRILVQLDEPASVTPGQSAVFYCGDYVLGGGIIDTLLTS